MAAHRGGGGPGPHRGLHRRPAGIPGESWLEILLPYLPLWGLAVRAPVGFIVWVGSLFALAAVAAPTSSVASLIVPSVVVIGFCTYIFERRWALITAVVAELLSFFVPFLFLDNGLNVGALLAGTVAIGVLGGLALNFYRHRAEYQESQIQDLSAKHAEVRSEERRKLGSELHDSVAHDVTVVAMQALVVHGRSGGAGVPGRGSASCGVPGNKPPAHGVEPSGLKFRLTPPPP